MIIKFLLKKKAIAILKCILTVVIFIHNSNEVVASDNNISDSTFNTQSNQAGYVSIDFNDVSIKVFTKFISELTGANIVLEEGIVSKVTVIMPTKIPIEESLKVYESVINAQNLELIEDGSVYKVIKRKKKLRFWVSKIYIVFTFHLFIWIILIFFYENSVFIQSFFFWSPKIRKVAGLGYIHYLILWVPQIRNLIFKPFLKALNADAATEDFDEISFYERMLVKKEGTKKSFNIVEAFINFKGQVLLEGDSGLGKTIFLRNYVKSSKKIMVFMLAEQCSKGVINGIQNKLHGILKDKNFLSSLIYNGGLEVIIDGLNEVNPDTRAEINHFIGTFTKCNIIISSQPIDWSPPKNVVKLKLLPLNHSQIEEFLLNGKGLKLNKNDQERFSEFQNKCKKYLNNTIKGDLPPKELEVNRFILSNPMDLTIVSQLLQIGETPNLFQLHEQQFREMEKTYKKHNLSRPFPLNEFSLLTYEMKLNNLYILPYDEFLNEIDSMEQFKMVLRRIIIDSRGNKKKLMYFRHEKFMDFFIVKHFLNNKELPSKHINDYRFRGVYFMLANLMPEDESKILREELIQYAAKTKDHNISDDFIKLLNMKKKTREKERNKL